jgi:NADPH:quinone reductase-like Zn-dependent oxidoreductase
VTAVCSTANVELLRSLGADTVLDYTKEEASALRSYDVVFNAVFDAIRTQKNVADESGFEGSR